MARTKTPIRFRNSRRSSCPACLDRNALNLVGRPLFVNGVRLSAGCEICKGTGRVVQAELVGGWPIHDLWVLAK